MGKAIGKILGGLEIIAGIAAIVISDGTLTPLAASLLGAGLATLAGSFIPTPGSPDFVQGMQNNRQTFRGAVVPHKVLYGQSRVSGPMYYLGTTGLNNKFMHVIVPLAGHAVNSIGNVIINGILMDGTGADPKYANNVRVKRHFGTAGQVADPDLIAELVDAAGLPIWDTAHVGNGIAYVYVRLEYSKALFPSGLRNIQADVQGALVFDPRTNTTAWSENWALCMRDYLSSSYGLELPAAEIDDASIIAAANISQESIATANAGSQKRYTVNGSVDLSHRPADIIRAMLTAGAGHLVPLVEGRTQLIPGAYATPTTTLTEADLRGAISYKPHPDRKSLFNVIVGKFSGKETNWQLANFPQVGSQTFITADNNVVVRKEISLPYCSDHERCQRIARLVLYSAREGGMLHMPCKLTALEVTAMSNVMVTLPHLSFVNKTFRVVGWTLTPELGVDLVLKEDTPASYAWLAAYSAPFAVGGAVTFGASGGGGSTSVSSFGALGDGIHDDTVAINNALDAVGDGGRIFLPRGEYFISGQLHLKTGMELVGEGPMNINELVMPAMNITYTGVPREYSTVVVPPAGLTLVEWIKGDPIRFIGFATAAHNGLHEMVSINVSTNTIIFRHTSLVSGFSEVLLGATATLEQLRGGTLLRFRSLVGVTSTGAKFFDVTDFYNVRLHNLGFLGPGVDAKSGGELRFRRGPANKALTGYLFDNISIADIANSALVIEGPVFANFSTIRIRHCAGDAFTCKPSPFGGSTTSCVFHDIYVTSSRRGMVIKQGVYFTIDACVMESVSVGFDLYNCSAFTLNSPATETIKQKINLGGQGVAIKMDKCYGFVINAPAIFYNTEPTGWGKASIECSHTSREKVAGVINGGRYHPSIAAARTVLAVEQTGFAPVAYISAPLATLQADYWKFGRQFLATGMAGVMELEFRHQGAALAALSVALHPGTNAVVSALVPPAITDDGTMGHVVGDIWTDTVAAVSYKMFDATTGAAVWKSEASVTVLTLDGRISQTVPITTTPAGRMTKIGRNFAADIITTSAYRVFESMHDGVNTLTLWLDMQDRMPNSFTHFLSFGPLNPYAKAELLQSASSVTVVNGVAYLHTEFRSGGLGVTYGPNFAWGGGLLQNPAPAGTTVVVKINNRTDTFIPAMVQYDAVATRLHFYFPVSEFFSLTNSTHVYGLMDDAMNGIYPVATTAVWEMSNASSSAGTKLAAALRVTYSKAMPARKRVLDWGIYTTPTASFDSESVLTLVGGNEIRIYDPRGIVGIGTERSGTVTLIPGAATVTITGKDMDKYDWLASTNGIDHVYAQIVDEFTVMFSRVDTTNQCDVMYTGRRRKSIGWLLSEPIPFSAPVQIVPPAGGGGGGGGGLGVAYVSPNTAIVSGAQVPLAHGLGSIPAMVQLHLINLTAEFGYTVGQQLMISSDLNSDLSSASRGVSCIVDATNITIRFGTSTTSILAIDAITGLRQRLTNANWNLVARAWS